MVDATRGFAVVSNSTEKTLNRFYLARTKNTGSSWSLVGPLPFPSFQGPPSASGPILHFVSSSVGYVSTSPGGRLFVTNDGGQTWARVTTPGIWPTYLARKTSVVVVSDRCTGPLPAYGPLHCPSVVSLYQLGRPTPEATAEIPVVNHTAWPAATALAAPTPSTLVVQEGGTQPGESTYLLESTDAGRTWHHVTNPCGQLLIQQLLTPTANRWLLSCFLDGGMMQGTNQLWESQDGGRRWTLLAYSGEQRFYVGDIADTWNTLAIAGDSRRIFSAVGGAGGGVESSMSGRWWVPARFYPASDGIPEWIDAFGATGMLFGNLAGNVWRTFDGVTWAPLKLTAGLYHNLPICTRELGVTVSLGPTRFSSATTANTVIFKNEGPHACYLSGAPSLQPVSGARRTPVGPNATSYATALQGDFIELRPHGGTASITLATQRVAKMPPGSCRVGRAAGAVVAFNPPASFWFSFGRHPREVCTLVSTSQVTGVVPGVGHGT